MELPTTKSQIERVNPKRLIIYSKPKTGKTSAAAELPNNLIIDLEDGSNYVEALKVKINNLDELKELGTAIKKANHPYEFVTLDTVTALEDMVKGLALKMYKDTPMGKNFSGSDVLSLPNGAGYGYLRQAFFSVLDYIDTFAPNIILFGHIKDKQVNDTGDQVMAANIDLTGKIKSIVCANADAIGYLYRKENKVILSFKTNDEVTCGARPPHLKNQEIVLSEIINDKLVTYWNKIYPTLNI